MILMPDAQRAFGLPVQARALPDGYTHRFIGTGYFFAAYCDQAITRLRLIRAELSHQFKVNVLKSASAQSGHPPIVVSSWLSFAWCSAR
jgi:hypothetical protein